MKQSFLDTGHQATQDSDPCKKENKGAKTEHCPSLLQGAFPRCWTGEQDPGGNLTASVSSEDRAGEAEAASLQGKMKTGESSGKGLQKVLSQGFI